MVRTIPTTILVNQNDVVGSYVRSFCYVVAAGALFTGGGVQEDGSKEVGDCVYLV